MMKYSILSLFLISATSSAQTQPSSQKIITLPLIPHHEVAKRHKNRSLLPSAPRERRTEQQLASLYQGYGTHYLDLWVGTPPQRQTVIVDTGSQLIAFPCEGCKDCGEGRYHTDGTFEYTSSATFEKLKCGECIQGSGKSCGNDGGTCHMGLSYQEGSSWNAFEGRDVTYVGGLHDHSVESDSGDSNLPAAEDPHSANDFSFPLSFGCQTSLTGLFKTQLADGILGMSMESGSLWKQMKHNNVIEKDQFALCFNRQNTIDRKGSIAGVITLGGYDEKLWNVPMVYAKNTRKTGFYTVHVRKVMLQAKTANTIQSGQILSNENGVVTVKLDVSESKLNQGGVIVDSGTTDTYFISSMGSTFRKVFEEFSGLKYSNKEQKITTEKVHELPTILIQMEGANDGLFTIDEAKTMSNLAGDLDPNNPFDVIISVPPEHYMEFDPESKKWTSRFYLTESYGSVLGANSMMGHDVLFDVDNGLVGWAESDCDYGAILNSNEIQVDEEKDEEPEMKHIDLVEVDDIVEEAIIDQTSTQNSSEGQMQSGEGSCSSTKCQFLVGVGLLLASVQAVYAWRYFSPNTHPRAVNTEDDSLYLDTEMSPSNPIV